MNRQPHARIAPFALAIVLTGFALGPAPVAAAGVGLGAGSALWLKGTSNLHDFEAHSTALVVRLTGVPAGVAALEAHLLAAGPAALEVDVPTRSLRSAKAALEKNMWNDLRADEFPAITFRLASYRLLPQAAPSDTLQLRLDGVLQIAGQERAVQLSARAHRTDAGVWVEGTHALRMSEYGIKPRTMMMGTLRVRDAVTVGYRLLLVPTL